MFGSTEGVSISWHGHRDWWYVEHCNTPHMCLYLSDDGKPYFGLKELSRVIPMVFNNRSTAVRVARQQKGRVKRYPYLLSSGTK